MGNGSSTKNKNGVLKETMADHEESINCMALSEDGSMLVTGSEDSTARMWSTKTEETECIGVLRYHRSRISKLTNPFRSIRIISSSIVNFGFFRGHSSYINCVAVCDTFVVTGSADTTVRKWDMTTCECLFVYEGHTGRVQK